MHKSFASIALPITEEEYRNDGNMHYSMLSEYERNGFSIIPKLGEKKDTPSLLFGSLVDVMLTGTRAEFDKSYIVADFQEPKPMHTSYTKTLFERCHIQYNNLLKIPDEKLLEVADELGFGKNWLQKTRLESIKKECVEYYNLLVLSDGKTVISTELYEQAAAAARKLRESPATAWYFAKDNPLDGIERVYQAKFKADFDGITYSCMADLIVIDHENKVVYPCDLKTSSHQEYEFMKSFIEWGYYIQAAQYAAIIKATMEKDSVFKDYKLMPYRFIVINKESLNPLVWEWPYTFSGVTVEVPNSKGYPYRMRNFREIGKELHHYQETQQVFPDGITTDKPNSIDVWLQKL